MASPLGVSKAADDMLPVESLTALLKTADAWVEFNNKWLLYSTAYDHAVAENKRLRSSVWLALIPTCSFAVSAALTSMFSASSSREWLR